MTASTNTASKAKRKTDRESIHLRAAHLIEQANKRCDNDQQVNKKLPHFISRDFKSSNDIEVTNGIVIK